MLQKRAILALALILLIQEVCAIGLTPTKIEIWYEPNKEEKFSYMIRTRSHESPTVAIYSKGYFKDSIIFENEIIEILPEVWTPLNFTIKFPPTAPPGLHEMRLGVVEASSKNESMIGVLTGVEMLLFIRVPFEGRHLELQSFEIPRGEVNKPVNFYITVRNIGKERVNDARARITIKKSDGEAVTTINTDGQQIGSRETATIAAEWQTSEPGAYTASALVIYDENRLEIPEKEFLVGELLLEIVNASAQPIKKGEIAKIYAEVKSVWNAEIKDVYAKLTVNDATGRTVGGSESQTVTMPPWATSTLILYWDSRDMEIGNYEGKITVNYAGKTAERLVMITIKNPSLLAYLKGNMTITLLIGAVVLLILINIIMMVRRKKKKRK